MRGTQAGDVQWELEYCPFGDDPERECVTEKPAMYATYRLKGDGEDASTMYPDIGQILQNQLCFYTS